MWMIDTGAGNHFVGKNHFSKEQLATLTDAPPLVFSTANGKVTADKVVLMHIDELDLDLPVYVLPN